MKAAAASAAVRPSFERSLLLNVAGHYNAVCNAVAREKYSISNVTLLSVACKYADGLAAMQKRLQLKTVAETAPPHLWPSSSSAAVSAWLQLQLAEISGGV